MKRFPLIVVLWSLLISAFWIARAAPANFSGAWTRDREKAEGMKTPLPSLTWIITQDENQLSVESTDGSGKTVSREVYKLDGTEIAGENSNSNPPRKFVRKANWLSGEKTLELVTKSQTPGDGVTASITMIIRDQWELSADGKELKVHRTVEATQGDIKLNFREIRFTFHKQA
jgi:hypothetical protein